MCLFPAAAQCAWRPLARAILGHMCSVRWSTEYIHGKSPGPHTRPTVCRVSYTPWVERSKRGWWWLVICLITGFQRFRLDLGQWTSPHLQSLPTGWLQKHLAAVSFGRRPSQGCRILQSQGRRCWLGRDPLAAWTVDTWNYTHTYVISKLYSIL